MPHRRVDDRIAVGNSAEIAVTAFLPDPPAPAGAQPVLFLFPGGTYTRDYYDLEIRGLPDYSQARWHAERGLITITVDHLGLGESSLPADRLLPGMAPEPGREAYLCLENIAAGNDDAVRTILDRLRAGTFAPGFPPLARLVPIGVGQSMGGHIVCLMQSAHATFDAVGLLGSSFTQTRMALLPGKRHPFRQEPIAAVYRSLAHDVDRRASFHGDDEPTWLVDLDMDPVNPPAWRTSDAPADAARLLEPHALAPQAAAIRVPVLLVYGEQDVTLEPLADLAMFRSAADLALLLVPRAGHMHNFAPTRHLVWTRLAAFADQVIALA